MIVMEEGVIGRTVAAAIAPTAVALPASQAAAPPIQNIRTVIPAVALGILEPVGGGPVLTMKDTRQKLVTTQAALAITALNAYTTLPVVPAALVLLPVLVLGISPVVQVQVVPV